MVAVVPAAPAAAATTDSNDHVGWYRVSDASFHLTNSHAPGESDLAYVFGPAGVVVTPLIGDWNGDGVDTAGWYRPGDGSFHLTDSSAGSATNYAFVGGPAGDATVTPVVGDWDGDGKDSVGWYRPSDGSFHLKNSLAAGASDFAFIGGPVGDASVTPLSGDWEGDGKDSVGWYRPSDASFHLSDRLAAADDSDYAYTYGPVASGGVVMIPVAGDFDGYVAPTPPSPAGAAAMVQFARAQIGEPYLWGAEGPSSWDCSGLVYRSLQAGGLSVDRLTADAYYRTFGRFSFDHADDSDLKVGDLLFWNNDSDAAIDHIAIYSGGGYMIEAPKPGTPVREVTVPTGGGFIWQAARTFG